MAVPVVGALILLAVSVAAIGIAGAAPTTGQQLPGSAVPISPDPNTGFTVTAGTPFSSGQTISVQVPANSVLSPTLAVKIVECSAPNDVLPTNPSACDPGQTVQGDPLTPNLDGSLTYNNYQTIALPDPTLGTSPINCDLTDECVLYIGDNYNDLSAPHFWSQGFFVSPNATDSGVNPGDGSAPSAATAPSATLSTVATSPATAVADGKDASTVTVTLLGLNGQSATVPVAGAPVTLGQGTGHSVISPTSSSTNSSGVATFNVTDSTAETVTYAASSGSTNVLQTGHVVFAPQTVSTTKSTIVASPPTVPADGSTASTVTVTVLDQAVGPQPIAGVAVTLSKGSGSAATITPLSPTSNSSGKATFSVTDSTVEPVTFSAAAGGVALSGAATVTFGTLAVSSTSSLVQAAQPTATVGPLAGTTVTVTLLTTGGTHPVAGKSVTLTGTGSSVVSPSSLTADVNGKAVFNVTDSTIEPVTFSATDVTDPVILVATASVTFQTAPTPTPSPILSTILVTPTSVSVDGSTAATVYVTLKDTSGNVLPNKVVKLTPTVPDVHVEISAPVPPGGTQNGETDGSGQATFQVLDSVAETVTLTATDTTDTMTLVNQGTVTFTHGPADAGQSSVSVNPSSVAADGHASATVTVTLSDHFGNGIAAKTIRLAQASGSSVISPSTAVTSSAGVATFTVTDTNSEFVTYTATDVDDGNLLIDQSVTVTFGTPAPIPPDPNASAIASNYSSVPADGTTAATLTVWLYDANGFPLAGRNVTINSSGSAGIAPPASVTNASGIATFAVTDAKTESPTFRATDTTDNVLVAGSVTIQFLPASSSGGGTGGVGGSIHLNQPIVDMAATPDGRGYWLVAADGGVFRFGDAGFFGSMGSVQLSRPIVGMAATPDGLGYWLVASDGGIFRFGDAGFFGSMGSVQLNKPVVGMAATPDGLGYWLVASDGGIFRFGDAQFEGSTGGIQLNKPVVGMAATPDGLGYWLVASDGGIFRFGDAQFEGSTGGIQLNKPVVGMAATPDGLGYWLSGGDGGMFTMGDATYLGSIPS